MSQDSWELIHRAVDAWVLGTLFGSAIIGAASWLAEKIRKRDWRELP